MDVFGDGALATGVTVDSADYTVLAVDFGIKYRGFFIQAEHYSRWLDSFDANGPLPLDRIFDNGFYVQTSFYPMPKKLEVYAGTSQIYGDTDAGFENSNEYFFGSNFHPFGTRDARLNLQYIQVDRSPVGSTFGFYTIGQKGGTLTMAVSLMF